ncbi:MAG: hypothetical protein V4510_05120 [bacterium]
MRVGVVLIALLAGLAVLNVMPVAQAAGEGTLYFDKTLSATKATAPCAGPFYSAQTTIPAAGKAYWGLQAGTSNCAANFDYTASEDFSMSGAIVFTMYVGCDEPAVVPAGQTLPVLGDVPSWDFTVSVGGKAQFSGQGLDQVNCSGGTAYTKLTATVTPTTPVKVATGDLVNINVDIYGAANPPSQSPQGNLFIATGDAVSVSGLTAMGIPGAPAVVGTESLNLGIAKSTASALPGNSALYNLTIKNLGTATKFTLSTSGLPSGYTAAFNPLTGNLAGNTTAASQLKVTVPSSASGGTHVPFKVSVVGTAGANKTIDVSLDVLKAATNPTPTPPGGGPGPGGSPDPGTTPGDGFTSEGQNPAGSSKASPGIEFAGNILAVGLLVVGLRRRQ